MAEHTLKPDIYVEETIKKAIYYEQEHHILQMKYEDVNDENFILRNTLKEAIEIFTDNCSFCPELPCGCPECEVKTFIKKVEELLK